MENKTYLITGGLGFIGANFIKYILEKHPNSKVVNLDLCTYAANPKYLKELKSDSRYIFVKGDISNLNLVRKLFKKFDFDYCINFAAESHVDNSTANPALFAKTNVLGTTSLLQAAREAWEISERKFKQGKRFVQISTDEVYGSIQRGFFNENSPLSPKNIYSSTKAAADLIVKSFFDVYGFPCLITRSCNNYGPNQNQEKLIPRCFKNAKKLKPIEIYGDGNQIRDWIYVLDNCAAIDLVCQSGKLGDIYNIASNDEKTNNFVAKRIINYVNKNINNKCSENLICYVKDRPSHDFRYGLDCAKISGELGFKPKVSFDDGLEKTLNWCKENM